jgi:Holliday junction DNA helicase RuvB
LFKTLFKKLGIEQEADIRPPEEKFFSGIVGYSDLKRLFMRSIISREPSHILLTGPPASSKTIFLLQMMKGLDNSYFTDGTGTSGIGMVDYLFEHPSIKYLLIDEIDKMKKSDQVALLNVMETGILSSTKVRKTRQLKMNLWIFATSNSLDNISRPLKSRFLIFHLPEYKYEEFVEISAKLLNERYKIEDRTALKIADRVWNELNSKDIRDVLKIGKMVKREETDSDIDWLIYAYKKYAIGERHETGFV